MALAFLTSGQPLLDDRFPLPLDEPFTRAMARAHGIGSNDLTRLVRLGLLRRLVENVYAAAQLVDSLEVRVAALRLLVPPGAVVTDRTAGWLHGADMILAPGDHVVMPRLSVFHRARGCRLRTDLTASGQRMMPDGHVMHIDGLLVTTPLRTACDLGRLLRRDAAFAALDSMLRLGLFEHAELLEWSAGFRGYRQVRQLRALAPLADARAESPPESVLRLRWLDCADLPRPEPQRPVPAPASAPGGRYWLDVGVDDLRFAVEYDGVDFHGVNRQEHDENRRDWIRNHEHWIVEVARKENLFGPHHDIEQIIRSGVRRARARLHSTVII
jgi:hypothetical protein